MPSLRDVGQMLRRFVAGIEFRWSLVVQLFSLGLVLGLLLRQPVVISCWLVIALGLILSVFIRRWVWLGLMGFFLVGLGLGMWRGQTAWSQFATYSHYVEQTVTLQGRLKEDGSYNDRGQRELLLHDVYLVDEQRSLPGVIQVTTFNEARYWRGDVVEVSGTLRERFGNRAGYIYFGQVRVVAESESAVESVRRNFFAGVFTALKSPEDSLGLGFLLGTRALLPESLNNQLAITGLTHIVAVSGYNLTVIIRICRRLLAPFSAFFAVAGSAGLVLGFVVMTGLVPSIFRASVVAALSLAAWYYGRRVSPWTLLLVSAAVTTMVRPQYLWADLGWWLSFLAFIGVLIIAPLVTARIFSERKPPLLPQIAIETTCAQLMALPLIGLVFGQLSLISIVANMLVLPLIPLAMLLTAVAGVAGMVVPSLVGWLAWPAQLLLELITSLVALLARVPHALVEVEYRWPTLAALYVVIVVLYLLLKRGASRDQLSAVREYNIVE